MSDYNEQLHSYRARLIETEQESQGEYDKTVLALSGGAFGISFAFIDAFVEPGPVQAGWLMAAWVAWGISITSVLFSFYFSTLALRKTVEQLDRDSKSLYTTSPGGFYTLIVKWLNAVGGALFLVGAACLIRFVHLNI